jgi:hypothetical protein
MSNLCSSIFAIPELLSLIFIHCLPDNGYALPDNTTAPTTLALVSRKWRDIAYATPRLWSSIDMAKGRHFCHPSDELAERQLALLDCWLARSGAVPLRLHMSYGGGEDDLERRILAPVLHASSHWLELDITACFESIQAILERMGHDAPSLSDVNLSSTSHRRGGNPASSQLHLRLRNSQRLERFICSGSHRLQLDATDIPLSLKVLKIAYSTISIPPHTQDFPSSNVRQLSLVRVSCSNASNLLDLLGSAFRNVEELKLEIVGTSGTVGSVAQLKRGWTVELPRLRTFHCKANFYDAELTFFDLSMTPESAFLSRLCLPSLTDLTFSVFTEDVLDHLASLFRRSRPPLTHLKLLGFIPTSFDVRNFFSELPSLSHLHIHNATHNDDVTKNVLTALTVRSAGPSPPTVHGRVNLDDNGSPEPSPETSTPLCPRLTHFEFAVWISRITPNYVTEMILSRCRHRADASDADEFPQLVPLQRFALSLLPSNAQAVLQHPEIMACVRDGLHVECEK